MVALQLRGLPISRHMAYKETWARVCKVGAVVTCHSVRGDSWPAPREKGRCCVVWGRQVSSCVSGGGAKGFGVGMLC
jgi:hypothetical protein